MAKRDIFNELLEGIEAIGKERQGKLTLRSHSIGIKPPPPVDAAYIRATRRKLRMSAPVFARTLRVSPRTLERWEQGQTPGAAAAVLIGLVRRHPETLGYIAGLETGARRSSERGAASGGRRRTRRRT